MRVRIAASSVLITQRFKDPETELTRGGADEEGLLSGERRLQPYVVAVRVELLIRKMSIPFIPSRVLFRNFSGASLCSTTCRVWLLMTTRRSRSSMACESVR